MLTAAQIAAIASKALEDKKAKDVKILRTTERTVLADYFVICNGTSSPTSRHLLMRWTSSSPRQGNPLCAARACAPISGCLWTLAA